ncbi:acid-activated periplasmic chaperone HdeB [Yersinia kristensenii]|uniref:acid-activated periplasmic chaperone HdeB n=1 Tax=Yersinia kristensenii TaxID=28152 RepID=UPI0005E93B05|nr:acid-activated periplasmic chaperone HdeB [Yersinia kristensenii]MDA5474057.1 acid-activated periplasmic chaperone HdeB [Yersinia kristensenii]MDA5476763.1 acid-activated periplasmic chaperone HdeB [Yersinia kristensenii]MDA5505266.1 acid-activated periplasmic chaperone HdeB [Yersinia kristensenii]NIK94155.1 acid-activated periplasmic chaperone HdeB [Yersinia kristensenii]NIL05934.1 acid-activated periplasmic chaperone HdeB [Yersinia kristensenii]
MFYKSLPNLAIATLLLTTMTPVFASSTTPTEMTCKEFLDLNPKSMTPVAFWILNEDTQYKKGDNVDFQEVDTVYTPKVIDICKKSPDKKVSAVKKDIMAAAKK